MKGQRREKWRGGRSERYDEIPCELKANNQRTNHGRRVDWCVYVLLENLLPHRY
jgi:hypothetical protein